MSLENHSRLIREHLNDARELCDRLGLLAGRFGRDWQKQSKGVMVLCPFDHDERSPSCSVVRAKDGTIAAHCHGCGASGDALTLIAAVLRIDIQRDFPEVLREAACIAGLNIDFNDRSDWRPRIPPPRPAPPPDPEPLDDDTFDAIAQMILASCPLSGDREVAQYLNSRRLGRLALSAGWAALPGDPAAREQLRAQIIAMVGDDAWMRSGLAVRTGRRRGAWVWDSHRLVIPWRGPGLSGSVQTIQRRCIGDAPEGVGKYIFPSGRAPRWPYGVDALEEAAGGDVTVVFVEGATDVLALRALCRSSNIEAAVLGVPGIQSWREGQGAAWAKLAAGRIAAVGLDLDAGSTAKAHVAAARDRMVRDIGAAGARRIDEWKPRNGAKDWSEQWAAERVVMDRRAS